MNPTRIYGQKITINPDNTRNFYNNRAKAIKDMDNPYVSVLLGDQNPEYALAWNTFEKENILPKMNIDNTCNVLDIGCGMGRWAEVLIPISGYYCGTDMSSEMIKCAGERNHYPERKYDFFNYGFEEFCRLPLDQLPCRFNRLWVCGVMMYINDDVLIKGMGQLLGKMEEHAKVYFTETIAVSERLTLDQFYSEALKADYDVIYRTEKEYNRVYETWIEAGFRITEQGMLPHLNKEKEYSETDRWYTILER
ncbi:MAG: class I SAM-dependent methyltransferase [Hungatella sp.]|nr:class I SAM-dependent methyltransferase [Hungatella sp.]